VAEVCRIAAAGCYAQFFVNGEGIWLRFSVVKMKTIRDVGQFDLLAFVAVGLAQSSSKVVSQSRVNIFQEAGRLSITDALKR
jgi:hypothetical protein